MIDRAILPKNDQDCVNAINDHCSRLQWIMSARWTKWLLAQLYLQGYRVFSAYDQHNVKITTAELNQAGEFPLKLSDLLVTINKIQGLLTSINLSPVVKRDGLSLGAIRERAMAQVIADSVFSKDQINRASPQFAFFFSLFGSAGLCGHLDSTPRVGPTCEVEVVHPREVIPFPDPGADYTKVRGMIRERYVPLSQLADTYGAKALSTNKDLATYERSIGTPAELYANAPFWNSPYLSSPSPAPTGVSQTTYTVARYRETFITGERNILLEYVASCGRQILYRKKYDSEQMFCPLAWARFMDTGSFHGAGMFDVLFSLIREYEKFVEDLIHNTKSLDRYPTVILPHGTISEKTVMRDTGHGMKFVFANAEPRFDGNPPIRPITVAPHNAGDLPGKTAAYLHGMVAEVTPIRDLIREKGRIDSLPALQFLSEEDSRSVSAPITAMSQAYSDVYRYGVGAAINRLTVTGEKLPVNRLDLSLLGAVVNFDDSTISLAKNLIPDVSRLSFAIAKGAQSEALKKQEAQAIAMLRMQMEGRGDWTGFVLTCLAEGIEIPAWIEPEKASYRTGIQQILTLFNDGQFPGLVWSSPYTDRPDIQIRMLKAVLSSPEMRYASPRVINAFFDYMDSLTAQAGGVLPDQVPDPYAMPGSTMPSMMGQQPGQQPQLTGPAQ